MKKTIILAMMLSVIVLTSCGSTNNKMKNVFLGKAMFSIPENWNEEVGEDEFNLWNQQISYYPGNETDDFTVLIMAYDYKEVDVDYGPAEKARELEEDVFEYQDTYSKTIKTEIGEAEAQIINGAQVYKFSYKAEDYFGEDAINPSYTEISSVICIHRDDLHYHIFEDCIDEKYSIIDMVLNSLEIAD